MSDGWRKQLVELRERFRQLCDFRNPIFHILTEAIGDAITRPMPFVIPRTISLSNRFFGDEFSMCSADEWVEEIPSEGVLKNSAGETVAIPRPRIIRISDLRGSGQIDIEPFKRAAADAAALMSIASTEIVAAFPETIRCLCQPIGSYSKSQFQKAGDSYQVFGPPKSRCDETDWILLLHRLAWIKNPKWRLTATRYYWSDDGRIRFARQPEIPASAKPSHLKQLLERVNTSIWYSILGDETPLDVFDASVRAIDILDELSKRPVPPPMPAAQPTPASPTPLNAGNPQAKPPRVILLGRTEGASVDGKIKELTETQYDVVEALVKAAPNGLKKVEIENIAKDARAILERLRRDEDWKAVIHMAGGTGRRYRID
jgi:hypothetical protein